MERITLENIVVLS